MPVKEKEKPNHFRKQIAGTWDNLLAVLLVKE